MNRMLIPPNPRVVVVIPTYNESENIPELIESLLTLDLDLRVLVVDDNSPDGTADRVEAYREQGVEVLRRIDERGYGSAVLAGFQKALKDGADLVVSMDADFSHDPTCIPSLVEACREADVSIGSRYIPGGGTRNWPFYRRFLSRNANRYVRTVLGMPVQDSTSGFRCYRRQVLESLEMKSIRSEGYSFLVEVLYRAFCLGAEIKEIPICFVDRFRGKSKINSREIYRSIYMVAWLRFWK